MQAATERKTESPGRRGQREVSPGLLHELRSQLPRELRHRLRRGRDLSSRADADPFPTGFAPLDRLLDGGLPRGALVELVGRRSAGRFATLLRTLATAGARGQVAALVDLGDGLDPRAATAAGVDLARLLWVRPRNVRQALAATEILLDGGFPLVLVDLGLPPVAGGRGGEAGWLRLARLARDRRAALLVATPYRATGTAATTVLDAGGPDPRWCPRSPGGRGQLLAGVESCLIRDKHPGVAPGARGRLRLHAGSPWAAGVVDRAAAETAATETTATEITATEITATEPANRPSPVSALAAAG